MTTWTIITDIAAELGVKPNTRRMWRARGRVPWRWHHEIVEAAKRRGVELSPRDLQAVTPAETEAA